MTLTFNDFKKPSLDHPGLYIGFSDPNEAVYLSGSQMIEGDILIVNQGKLHVENADFILDGKMIVIHQGQFEIKNSDVTIRQEYIYEHNAIAANQAQIIFDHINFKSSGQSWGLAATDTGFYKIASSSIKDGYITTTLLKNASAEVDSTQTPGEFLCMGSNQLSFQNSEDILMWLVLPDASMLDVTLPDDSLITNWNFPQDATSCNGFDYSVSMQNCEDVLWGLISQSGSDAVFRDTDFRVAGLMFTTSDSIAVHNIANNSNHVDDFIAASDRDLHLINSTVKTWNFYASKHAILSIHNSVFGEVLAMDTSEVTLTNCICDGTGGYAGASGYSLLLILNSMIQSQLIGSENAICVCAYSSCMGTEIDADSAAMMLMLNSSSWVEPEAHASANMFDIQLPYIEGFVNDYIPVIGTAQIISGPRSPLRMEGFNLNYKSILETSAWKSMGGYQTKDQVVDDTLTLWNTWGLLTGGYEYTLNLHHNFNDSLSIHSVARLETNPEVPAPVNEKVPLKFDLYPNMPNPFNLYTQIQFDLSEDVFVHLMIYDIRGKRMKTLISEKTQRGHYTVHWDGLDEKGYVVPSGVYIYQLKAGGTVLSKKMMVLK